MQINVSKKKRKVGKAARLEKEKRLRKLARKRFKLIKRMHS